MKSAAIFGKLQGGIVDKPEPFPHGDLVVVKVHSAPMCTEYKSFRDGNCDDLIGHEAAGEVVSAEKGAGIEVGTRVAVQPQSACGKCELCASGDHIHCEHIRDILRESGNTSGTATMAQYLLKPAGLLTPIPASMSYDHAAMACCGLGPTFGAMQAMKVDAFDTVLITGLGAVGLGGVINAKYRGARVIGVDSNPWRGKLALTLGAEAVIDPQREDAVSEVLKLTRGLGADKAIEASGVAETKPFILAATRRRGQVAFVGANGQADAGTILGKGLIIHGAWHYNLHDAGKMLRMIAAIGPQLDRLITHTFPLARVQEAWELQTTGNCGKVVLHPWEER